MLSGGKLYLASPTLVTGDKSSPSYSRRPAIVWAEVALSPTTGGTEQCAQSKAGAASLATWDWQRDYSANWGSEVGVERRSIVCRAAADAQTTTTSSCRRCRRRCCLV